MQPLPWAGAPRSQLRPCATEQPRLQAPPGHCHCRILASTSQRCPPRRKEAEKGQKRGGTWREKVEWDKEAK